MRVYGAGLGVLFSADLKDMLNQYNCEKKKSPTTSFEGKGCS
jgi:hypothetical protein